MILSLSELKKVQPHEFFAQPNLVLVPWHLCTSDCCWFRSRSGPKLVAVPGFPLWCQDGPSPVPPVSFAPKLRIETLPGWSLSEVTKTSISGHMDSMTSCCLLGLTPTHYGMLAKRYESNDFGSCSSVLGESDSGCPPLGLSLASRKSHVSASVAGSFA